MPRCVKCGKYIPEGEAFWIPEPISKYPWGLNRTDNEHVYLRHKFWNPVPCFCTHCFDLRIVGKEYIDAVTAAKRAWILTTEYQQNPIIDEYWLNNV
jgi:hypothetical protein